MVPCHSKAKYLCKGVEANGEPKTMSRKVKPEMLAPPCNDARTPISSFAEIVNPPSTFRAPAHESMSFLVSATCFSCSQGVSKVTGGVLVESAGSEGQALEPCAQRLQAHGEMAGITCAALLPLRLFRLAMLRDY